jgi:hypothetical protein
MRMEILEGVALVGGWGPDGYFCPSGHIVLDARTNEPTSCLNFSGRAWADPFMPSMVLLDDPHTVANPRAVLIGKETADSVETRAGYKRGFYGKRAAPDSTLSANTRAWIDGYLDGRRDKAAFRARA